MKADLIKAINHLVQNGQSARARTELQRLPTKGLTRETRYELACLARRAGLPDLTLRLLSPLVRPPGKTQVQAAEKEKAEYAAALVRIGAAREALGMLREINPEQAPQVRLYLAHALFTQWNYRDALPVLKNYLGTGRLDEYQRVVGNVNLASAYVHERLADEADPLLQQLLEDTARLKLTALHGNTLERLAELAIQQRNWRKAEKHLAAAERSVEKAGGLDVFFVHKWRSVLALFQKPKRALPQMVRFEQLARRAGHWETVRECDAYRVIACKDRDLFLRVYHGTPFEFYRKRLLEDSGFRAPQTEGYPWRLDGSRPTRVVDPLRHSSLKIGQLKHRLLKTLASDFYRPFRAAHLFSEVYPGERFQVASSRARVYEAVRELRVSLEQRHVPLEIIEKNGEYRLVGASPGVTLTVPTREYWVKNSIPGMAQIRRRAGKKAFSAAETAEWLRIPRRTAFHILQDALRRHWLVKSGAGPATRYRLETSDEIWQKS